MRVKGTSTATAAKWRSHINCCAICCSVGGKLSAWVLQGKRTTSDAARQRSCTARGKGEGAAQGTARRKSRSGRNKAKEPRWSEQCEGDAPAVLRRRSRAGPRKVKG